MMMKRSLAASVAAALIMLGASEASAQGADRAAFDGAVKALTARLGPTETGPAIESTDAAANAADLAVIEQSLEQLGTPAFPIDGFATFEAVCEPLNALAVRHTLDGLSAIARPPGAPPPTPAETTVLMGKVQALQVRNVARYPDQTTVLSAGGMRCMIKHFPMLTAHLDGLPAAELTPTRLAGAQSMRRGGAQALLGYAMALRELGTSSRNKARLRAYIAEMSEPLAATLTPELRANLIAQLDLLPPTRDPDTQATTQLLKAAMATTTCEGLCRY